MLNVCVEECSPLLPGSCGAGLGCYPEYDGNDVVSFFCFMGATQGLQGDECGCTNCCADGLFCAADSAYGSAWCADAYCCTVHCDVSDPSDPCVVPGQQCVPLFNPSDPIYGAVGACLTAWP